MNSKFLTLLITLMITLQAWSQQVKLNQLGFYPEGEKLAIVPSSDGGTFQIITANGNNEVFSGTLSESSFWNASGETVRTADFSEVTTEGNYKVRISGFEDSEVFTIGNDIYSGLLTGAARAYYYNRASIEITSQFGGEWARAAGHPDTEVFIHSSAASTERPTGTVVSSPKGWYDAGDYNKYVVNAGISTYTLLAAYEHFPEYYNVQSFNIPESGNSVPDILDEIKWELDWLQTMQDPNDGGVYHKLTTLNFSGRVVPEDATNDRFMIAKSVTATLDFAATMAVASRVYADYEDEFPGVSQEYLDQAIEAWDWAIENEGELFTGNPSGVSTGAYSDRTTSDEFDWAAAELYITTQDDDFYTATNLIASFNNVPGWQDVRGLAWISLAHHIDNLTEIANTNTIRSRIINLADDLADDYEDSPYRISVGNFFWGSNSLVANQAVMLIQAFRLTEEERYLNAAIANLDYLLGRNPVGISYVTGFGDQSPTGIHHRPSDADGILEPVPGFLVGGPHSGQQDGCDYPSNLPALSYLDDWCSFSTNEVTINWNAPLLYIVGAIEFYKGDLDLTVTEQQPFGGTPWPIPGSIEGEDYDEGGQGISFFDNSPTNEGGEYRNDGVDIESNTDNGNGFHIGQTGDGEWVEYTVDIAEFGLYDFNFRVSSNSSSARIRLELDEEDITGNITIGNTGGDNNWINVGISDVQLQEGEHILRVFMTMGEWNLNFFSAELVTITDCNGDIGGSASIDECDVCSGGNTGVVVNEEGCVTGINDELETILDFFPNPASGIVNISESVDYQVFNALGEPVIEGVGDVINLENQNAGIYIVKVGQRVYRLVKE